MKCLFKVIIDCLGLLQILSRDPDARHHHSFIRILEDTGQVALAAHLKVHLQIGNMIKNCPTNRDDKLQIEKKDVL